MVEYTIPAIPTVYNGRTYRSRLEARWAAYFDLLGWQVEYEPIDFGLWSPDFAIEGLRPHSQIFVEVKPITEWDRITGRKMADAVRDSSDHSSCNFILVGRAPMFGSPTDVIGWVGMSLYFEAIWAEATLGLDSGGRIDMNPSEDSIGFDMSTLIGGLPEIAARHSTQELWTEAANIVQWKGPTKRKTGAAGWSARKSGR